MTERRLVLLLFVYVGLDLANPLMPGAVRFVEGAVLAVEADRCRAERLPTSPSPPSADDRREPVVTSAPVRHAAVVPAPHRHWSPPRQLRSLLPETPAPSDDH